MNSSYCYKNIILDSLCKYPQKFYFLYYSKNVGTHSAVQNVVQCFFQHIHCYMNYLYAHILIYLQHFFSYLTAFPESKYITFLLHLLLETLSFPSVVFFLRFTLFHKVPSLEPVARLSVSVSTNIFHRP